MNRGDLACNGWRLDKMEVGPGGIGQLVVAEGFLHRREGHVQGPEQARSALPTATLCTRPQGWKNQCQGSSNLDLSKSTLSNASVVPVVMWTFNVLRATLATGGMAGWAEDLPVKKLGYGR